MSPLTLQSLWSATAIAGPATGELTSSRRADVVIIGAGYTGLSAAVHLAEAGRSVVVLESTALGERASGLNGGQVIAGVKHDPDQLQRMFGEARGARYVQTVARAPDTVFELIGRLGIECDALRSGWLQPAASEEALPALAARAEQWRRRGDRVELVSREQMQRLTGSQRYCGGLFDARGGTVQPLSYVRGLAHAVLRFGGELFTHSPVVRLARCAGGYRAETPRGEVTASTVILATNAYTGSLNPRLRRTVVAVPSFQVATAPIPSQLRSQILPGGQAASDTCRLLRYFRTDAGGRLVMGTRGSYAAAPTAHMARHHYQAVREIYPQLAGLDFDYHWGGFVAMTADHLPHLHELAPNLLAALGYNGRGVAMASVMGRLLAQRVLGMPAEELGFPVTAVHPIRLHAFSRLGVRATIQYLRLRDSLERPRR
ncbi:MAG: FAD-binding oxidoreductase [Proteobacteria bacterium]|nr:FAD-binding oxidoreductase [Pseudomonadota bacterium]